MRGEAPRRHPEAPESTEAPLESAVRRVPDADWDVVPPSGDAPNGARLQLLKENRSKLEGAIADRSRKMLELSGSGKFGEVEDMAREIAALQENLSVLTENIDRLTDEEEFHKNIASNDALREGETSSLEENLAWVEGEAKKTAVLGPDLAKSVDWIEEQERKRVEAEEIAEQMIPIDETDENLMWVEEEAKRKAVAQERGAEERKALGLPADEGGEEPPFDERGEQRIRNEERLRTIKEGEFFTDERGAKMPMREGLSSLETRLKNRGIDVQKLEGSRFERAKLRVRMMFDADLKKLVGAFRTRKKEFDYFSKRSEIYKKE